MDEQTRERFDAMAYAYRSCPVTNQADVCRKFDALVGFVDGLIDAAALSQPAAQGDSSHSAGGECGGVQVPTDEDDVDDRPWIPANGRIPDDLVDSDLVDLKFADGIIFSNEEAAGWQWDDQQGNATIVAYRMAVL